MPRYTFPVGTPLRRPVKNPNCAQRTFLELGSAAAGVECEAPALAQRCLTQRQPQQQPQQRLRGAPEVV